MRSMTRFLLAGILLCIGLQVSEVQPVYADNWEPGTYLGFFDLVTRSYTETHTSGNGGSSTFTVGVSWRVRGRLRLKITDAEHAVLRIENRPPVQVGHASFNDFSAGGKNCTWWDNMDGMTFLTEARSLVPSGTANNFAAGKFILVSFWAVPVTWGRVDGSSFGNAEGCAEKWGDELAEAQQKPVDLLTEQLKEILFRVVFFGPDMIGGPIFLPSWEDTFPISHGRVERTVPTGAWRVYKVGSKEWKNWMKGQK